ncbi:hypothetical protein LTR28_009445 [Elasticomyces elasticus]|nr:hypothetical protein LTR28_009445 [Elasticomyces elasticus]
MDQRRNDITDATPGTCSWILKEEEYEAWMQERKGLLWIKGNPGVGKSTLLKHILRNEPKRTSRQRVEASFFFTGRGSDLQKTRLGLFRSLLHQLLRQTPSLLSRLAAVFKTKRDQKGEWKKDWDWHENELREFFADYIIQASETFSVHIYVDALDEAGETVARDLEPDPGERATATARPGNSGWFPFSGKPLPPGPRTPRPLPPGPRMPKFGRETKDAPAAGKGRGPAPPAVRRLEGSGCGYGGAPRPPDRPRGEGPVAEPARRGRPRSPCHCRRVDHVSLARGRVTAVRAAQAFPTALSLSDVAVRRVERSPAPPPCPPAGGQGGAVHEVTGGSSARTQTRTTAMNGRGPGVMG